MWSFSQLRFILSLSQATFFSLRCRCLFFVPFCCALRMFSKRSFGSCVQLLASSALMSLSTFLWLFLFPKVGKISKTRYQINDGVMTSFARCPLGAFRLVFDQISSFSWSSSELHLLFLYMKRVFYIAAVFNFRSFSLSVADLDVSCVFYHFFGQYRTSCLHWNFNCVRPFVVLPLFLRWLGKFFGNRRRKTQYWHV